MSRGGFDIKQNGQEEPEGNICREVSVPGRGTAGAKALGLEVCLALEGTEAAAWLQQRELGRKQTV